MNVNTIVSALRKLDTQNKIKFILHFGSSAHGKSTPRDIDIGVYYKGTKEQRFKFRIKASGALSDKIDLHIFQDVPLTVQREMLQGKVAYMKDEDCLYDEAIRIVKEFRTFEKYYNAYFKRRAIA